MTPTKSTGRFDAVSCPSTETGLWHASQVASAIKERWQRGERPDVAKELASHSDLRQFRSVVLDLAYQEYALRLQAGEELDAESFSQRFPTYQRSLFLLIAVHGLLSHDPEVQALQGDLRWPEPGSTFMQLELVAELGRGTFGRVFLANEPSLGNRRVVVKVAPHGGEEAEMLGRLQHPNIVPVYSLQEDEETGLAAFCMPYLGRATLCDILDRAFSGPRRPTQARTILKAIEVANESFDSRAFPRPAAVLRTGSYVDGVIHLGVQLADALAHSHERGIYHRDLKPSNVLMSPDGAPLLLDFNLSVDNRFLAGRIGGTVPYMAPEELTALYEKSDTLRARYYDPRSDLFSLGAILYELLTGLLPFGAIPWERPVDELARQLHQRQENGPNSLRELNPQVDLRLARLIESCLALEPEQRPETARALADGLRKQISPLRRSRRWIGNHHKLVAGMAAIFLASVLATILFFVFRPPYSARQLELGLTCSRQGEYVRAVDYLGNSIQADSTSSEAFFARGKALQRLGRFPAAAQDYHSAYQLARTPLFAACEGYCWSRARQHAPAITAYRVAIDAGYDSPALLYNNIGFDYLQLKQFKFAEDNLRRAIQLDDNIQAAHLGMIRVLVDRAAHGQLIPRSAFRHITRAIETGPQTADLCRQIALLYVTAAKGDSALVPRAIQYVGKAVELGCDPNAFLADSSFSAIQADPSFRAALHSAVSTPNATAAVQLLDPLDKL